MRFSRGRIITPRLLQGSESLRLALKSSAIHVAAITQIAECRRDRGPVKPASLVRGRSEAEWLDRAEDRRTIDLVMAAVRGDRIARYRRPNRRLSCAGWKTGREATLRGVAAMMSGANARSMYRTQFSGETFQSVPISGINRTVSLATAGGGFSDVKHGPRSTGRQRHASGRERPPQRTARTEIGGKERRSLTPQMLLHYCRQPRRLRHGRHKAPPASLQRSRSQ